VSGDACDSFNRYSEDIALVAALGLDSYRFSLEWSRIEPEEGEFSLVALDHYRRMAAACHEAGVMPVVTYHHFTHPRWLAAAGTWEALHAPDRFARFCERATGHLGDLVGMACTLNEPNVVATMGWRHGIFPPGVRDRVRRDVVNAALVAAHGKAVDAIRSGPGEFPVGLTLSMTDYQLQPGGDEWLERVRRPSEDVFLEAIGTDDDEMRTEYVRRALAGLGRCLDDGIDVRGYFYWSLLDNFEWVLGYGPTFGIVAVDRQSFERRPKPSAAWLGGIARANRL
jgi:beta-glucosidase